MLPVCVAHENFNNRRIGFRKVHFSFVSHCRWSKLICDDGALTFKDDNLIMSKPPTFKCLEIRGLGLISVPLIDENTVDLIVDLAKASGTRLGAQKQLALTYLVFTGVIFIDCQTLYLFGQVWWF